MYKTHSTANTNDKVDHHSDDKNKRKTGRKHPPSSGLLDVRRQPAANRKLRTAMKAILKRKNRPRSREFEATSEMLKDLLFSPRPGDGQVTTTIGGKSRMSYRSEGSSARISGIKSMKPCNTSPENGKSVNKTAERSISVTSGLSSGLQRYQFEKIKPKKSQGESIEKSKDVSTDKSKASKEEEELSDSDAKKEIKKKKGSSPTKSKEERKSSVMSRRRRSTTGTSSLSSKDRSSAELMATKVSGKHFEDDAIAKKVNEHSKKSPLPETEPVALKKQSVIPNKADDSKKSAGSDDSAAADIDRRRRHKKSDDSRIKKNRKERTKMVPLDRINKEISAAEIRGKDDAIVVRKVSSKGRENKKAAKEKDTVDEDVSGKRSVKSDKTNNKGKIHEPVFAVDRSSDVQSDEKKPKRTTTGTPKVKDQELEVVKQLETKKKHKNEPIGKAKEMVLLETISEKEGSILEKSAASNRHRSSSIISDDHHHHPAGPIIDLSPVRIPKRAVKRTAIAYYGKATTTPSRTTTSLDNLDEEVGCDDRNSDSVAAPHRFASERHKKHMKRKQHRRSVTVIPTTYGRGGVGKHVVYSPIMKLGKIRPLINTRDTVFRPLPTKRAERSDYTGRKASLRRKFARKMKRKLVQGYKKSSALDDGLMPENRRPRNKDEQPSSLLVAVDKKRTQQQQTADKKKEKNDDNKVQPKIGNNKKTDIGRKAELLAGTPDEIPFLPGYVKEHYDKFGRPPFRVTNPKRSHYTLEEFMYKY